MKFIKKTLLLSTALIFQNDDLYSTYSKEDIYDTNSRMAHVQIEKQTIIDAFKKQLASTTILKVQTESEARQEQEQAQELGISLEQYRQMNQEGIQLENEREIRAAIPRRQAEQVRLQEQEQAQELGISLEQYRQMNQEGIQLENEREIRAAIPRRQAEQVRLQEQEQAQELGISLEQYRQMNQEGIQLENEREIRAAIPRRQAEQVRLQEQEQAQELGISLEQYRQMNQEGIQLENEREIRAAIPRRQAEQVRLQEQEQAQELGISLEQYRQMNQEGIQLENEREIRAAIPRRQAEQVRLQEQEQAQELGISLEQYRQMNQEGIQLENEREIRAAIPRRQAEQVRLQEQEQAQELGISLEQYRQMNQEGIQLENEREIREIRFKKFNSPEIYKTNINLLGNNINKIEFINNREFILSASSGANNNCLLYSIIRNDQSYLENIIENSAVARRIISIPENPFAQGGRNLNLIRNKIFQDIKNNLNKEFTKSMPNFKAEKISIQQIVDDIKNEDYSGKYKHFSTRDFLEILSINEDTLSINFTDIISVLYGRPIYVMAPKEDKTELNIFNGQYCDFSSLLNEPIFVFHRGFGGNHYSKLMPVLKLETNRRGGGA